MSETELHEYLAFAEDLARQAGEIALRYAPDPEAVLIKSDYSPVTKVDQKVNRLVIEKAHDRFPHIGVLGEEDSSNGEPTSGLLWVCDPLDGTIPFVLGLQISTFCLALVGDGEPKVGIVYDFAHDKLYSAAKGLGVFCNGEKFYRPTNNPLQLVEVESWHSAPNDVSSLLAKLQANRYQTPNFASFGNACLMVANKKISGAIIAGDKPWDVAAAKVIVEELGFNVTDIHGHDQRYDQPIKGAIVADVTLHKELLG